MTGTCGPSASGDLLARPRAPPGAPCRTAAPRPGTPGASRRPSRRPAGPGRCAVTSRAIMSRQPADGVDGRPSGGGHAGGHAVEGAEVQRRRRPAAWSSRSADASGRPGRAESVGGPLASLRRWEPPPCRRDRPARDVPTGCTPPARLAAETGIDLLVLTPGLGPALPHRLRRARDGAAHRPGRAARGGAVPRRPAAGGADGRREPRPARWASRCSPGTRPTTRSRCSPRRRPPGSGAAPARVAVGARTWAEHALGRAAGAARLGAGARRPGARPAAHGQVRRPRSRSWPRPAPPSTGCTPAMAEFLHRRPHGGGRGRRHRRGDPRGGPRRRRLHHRRLRARTAPARTTSCPTG